MNVQALDADVDFICGSTSASYSPTNKRRNMNIEYQHVATVVWESDGEWSFDDVNNTDTPLAYKTLANASASYLIPTTAIRIEQVEVKDNSSIWHKLQPVTLQDIDMSPEQYLTGTGMPIQYALIGNEIRLFPAPGTGSVTMASGMAVRLNRAVTELAVTATTTSPGFATAYHRILSLAASIDFIQDEQTKNSLLLQKARLEQGLTRFYAKRAGEFKTRIKPATLKRWRLYV